MLRVPRGVGAVRRLFLAARSVAADPGAPQGAAVRAVASDAGSTIGQRPEPSVIWRVAGQAGAEQGRPARVERASIGLLARRLGTRATRDELEHQTKSTAGDDDLTRSITETAHGFVEQNAFEVRRGLADYRAKFGDAFARHLERLGPEHHHLDSGAGECVAVLEYLNSGEPDLRARVTAVSYVVSDDTKNIASQHPTLHLLTGRFFEALPLDALTRHGKVDLLTDLLGVLSYTSQPSTVLRRYVEILADPGKMYVCPGRRWGNWVRCDDGETRTLGEWIARRPGLRVEDQREGMSISVVDRARVHIPELRIQGIDARGEAPYRKIFWEVTERQKSPPDGVPPWLEEREPPF